MTDPTQRNRLEEEASPYLRQHADNPVNWQPWDEEALTAARERDVPIFLSIGYSACHWCHVMEDESFDDGEVARILNRHFVPIKVDREERPDVDSIYMTACQLTTGRGGWPLSAWLTPDEKPFYVGTYFPKRQKRGMPGFLEILENVRTSWEDDREGIETRAQQWTNAVRDRLESSSTGDHSGSGADVDVGTSEIGHGDESIVAAAEAAMRGTDGRNGGFGEDGPKFPQPARLRVLARAYHRTGADRYLDHLERTLDAMATGGLYDHLGGGFHRYCVDPEWTVPHFEKMLYDNAELPRTYLLGYQLSGDERYARVVKETMAFVDRELTHPDGGVYSTLDAQSETSTGEREEGAFFVWTPEEVHSALDDDVDADLVCERFGVTERGNFEGKTVLNVEASIADLAESFDLGEGAVLDRLEDAVETLRVARGNRPRPGRDEKVLAGWNGLFISAAAEAAIVLGEDEYADAAAAALAFVRDRLWTDGGDDSPGRLARRFKGGDVAVDGYLDDYAFLARGSLDCYQATGDVSHLSFSLDLARAIEAEFWDDGDGTLYFTPERGESLVTRPQELADQSTPSSVGVAVETFLALDEFGDEPFGDVAETVLETHAPRVRSNPIEHATLSLASDSLAHGPTELTVTGENVPTSWRSAIGERYLPDRILARRPAGSAELDGWIDRLDLSEPPAIWADRDAENGGPTVYACRHRTCSPPTNDVSEALTWVDERTGEGTNSANAPF